MAIENRPTSEAPSGRQFGPTPIPPLDADRPDRLDLSDPVDITSASPNPNYPEHDGRSQRGAQGEPVKPTVEARQGQSVGIIRVLTIGLILVVIGFAVSYLIA